MPALDFAVMERWMELQEKIVNQEAAKEALESIVKAIGGSVVTDPEIVTDYDIDHDVEREIVRCRYVMRPGLNIRLKKDINSIKILGDRVVDTPKAF